MWIIASYGVYMGHEAYWRVRLSNITYKVNEISMWAKLPIINKEGENKK